MLPVSVDRDGVEVECGEDEGQTEVEEEGIESR
jgi:hypothetical protein